MSDGDKKGGNQNVPKPGAGGSAPGQVSAFQPNLTVRKLDILTCDTGGWWVCMNTHTTGQVFHLRPGQSDSNWHFSTGPS